MTILEFAAPIVGGIVGFAAFSYYVAHIADKGASKAAKDRVAQSIASFQLTPRARSAFKSFLFAADSYFGKAIFSWKALYRSVLCSIVWIGLVISFGLAIDPTFRSTIKPDPGSIVAAGIWLVLAALLIDYLSVCLTRGLIRWSLPRGRRLTLLVAVGDLVASSFLFYLLFGLAKLIVTQGRMSSPLTTISQWMNPYSTFTGACTMPDGGHELVQDCYIPLIGGSIGNETYATYALSEGTLFFSSLLTSVWMWCYVIGYWLLVSAVRVDALKKRVERYFDIDENPFYAIAWAAVIVFTAASGVAIGSFAVWLAAKH